MTFDDGKSARQQQLAHCAELRSGIPEQSRKNANWSPEKNSEHASRKTHVIEFVLLDAFSMMSLTSAIEPLRAANRLLDREVYKWRFTSEDGNTAIASNGIEVKVHERFGTSGAPDFVFVCAGMTLIAQDQNRLSAILNKRARQGCKLGALSMGAVFLARAEVLNDARCTLHWEGQPAFREEFPEVRLCNDLYVIDRNRYTCAGGTASLDMMLHLITREHGAALARSVANQFQVDRIRKGDMEQRPGSSARWDTLPPQIMQASTLMKTSFENPISMKRISRAVGLSVRNLERLFQRHTSQTPARYYKVLRLEHARDLLMHTNLASIEIAIATGFCSSSYFSVCYNQHFGHSPSRERRRNL
ncbi:GlxA family transcriptional regulator [Mesorhizobium sp.]|uniref:GlxA family transcriptional regulator n=1 Tax=Mesorhizobium sp. TaxID=1871066 RepID=UPI000FE9A5E5|nr:GlxA family transcriptional regulator [Mesorhizobium sp.]RWD51035.1 MAG: GlxA family transcriptional regulator [Mesorhizobium sp.]RWD95998.1 MAG: GlxA family transcriptional regulator [Mesorhizobium sp.]